MSRGSAMGAAALRPRSLSRASTALGMEPGGGARRLCRSLAGIARGFGWTMGRSDAFRGSSMAAAAPASGRGQVVRGRGAPSGGERGCIGCAPQTAIIVEVNGVWNARGGDGQSENKQFNRRDLAGRVLSSRPCPTWRAPDQLVRRLAHLAIARRRRNPQILCPSGWRYPIRLG